MTPSHLGREIEKALNRFDRLGEIDEKSWKGKKVISAGDWLKMIRAAQNNDFISLGKVMQFIPDDHIQHFLFKSIPDDRQDAWNNWWKDYIEFLGFKKNAKLGSKRCEGCLICPSSLSYDFERLRPIILKSYFDNSIRPEERCQVHNYFMCPYGPESKKPIRVDDLFELESLRKILINVITYLSDKTSKYDSYYNRIFVLNFETQSFEFSDKYCGKCSSPKGSLNNELDLYLKPKPEKPEIEMRTAQDMYQLLTNANLLKKATFLMLVAMTDVEISKLYTAMNRESLAELLTKHFMEITSKVHIKDLRSWNGFTAEYEMKNGICEAPNFKVLKRCINCVDYATCNCANCKASICICHWREHGVQVHNWKPNNDY